ncbi:uncharacterized protein LOC113215072 [Frankliniella occidentalis]|uniref:Uncharacterized protein LOC113215072 n=1 Tax=Frankliniella occidentalis TaxID=133901 RepID=A0A9C6X3P3_FRAOC|nr:uncharacterized protein LOC113215072 [Frankliniella occidentalis]
MPSKKSLKRESGTADSLAIRIIKRQHKGKWNDDSIRAEKSFAEKQQRAALKSKNQSKQKPAVDGGKPPKMKVSKENGAVMRNTDKEGSSDDDSDDEMQEAKVKNVEKADGSDSENGNGDGDESLDGEEEVGEDREPDEHEGDGQDGEHGDKSKAKEDDKSSGEDSSSDDDTSSDEDLSKPPKLTKQQMLAQLLHQKGDSDVIELSKGSGIYVDEDAYETLLSRNKLAHTTVARNLLDLVFTTDAMCSCFLLGNAQKGPLGKTERPRPGLYPHAVAVIESEYRKLPAHLH